MEILRGIARLAARSCGTSAAFIARIDGDAVELVDHYGLSVRHLPVEGSFCARVATAGHLLVADGPTSAQELVERSLSERDPFTFLAGVPIGVTIVLCVLDVRTRALSADEGGALTDLGAHAARLLGLAAAQCRSRSFADQLFDASPDAMLLVATNGEIRQANRSAAAVFGYGPDELVGRPIEVLLPESLRETHVRLRAAFFAAPSARSMGNRTELVGRRKDGGQAPVDIMLGPVETEHGTAALVVVRDLTERRQAEERFGEVRQAHDHLELRVQERTVELERSNAELSRQIAERERAEESLRKTEEQFRQAQKMEAIGKLAGGVAHDFNNLLSVVLSYSSMLIDDLKPGEPMRADLEEIMAAGVRASDLTRQLLAFGRQQVLQQRPLDLNGILASAERMLRRVVGEDVELTLVAAPAIGLVVVDASQVEQVLMNLVVNARDAMPSGGKLTIETANIEVDEAFVSERVGLKPGPHVMLAVSDTGMGMDKATQARIFEPFFTTKELGRGTGLGLSTVFGIVQQSGGSIWVYSEPGRGTTFKVYFPQTTAILTAAAETVRPPVAVRGGTETILLVEDEESVRALTRTILRRFGYDVIEAQSGGDALLICEQHPTPIHLLLTDVIMPRLSGPQLSERLLAIRPAMKVLYMSGYTDSAIVHHGVLDSGVAFLQKPITPATLARKVREVLIG